MSKHLRFKSLLGVLAIMLTLSMSWSSVSAQNTSSDKEITAFSVAGISATITGQAIAVTVPFGTDLTSLKTMFTIPQFGQLYWGKQVAGAFVAGDLMVSGNSYDYSGTDLFVTSEAENHSFVYYSITVTTAAASTTSDLLTVQLDYDKWHVLCGPQLYPDPTAPTAFTAVKTDPAAKTILFTTLAYANWDQVSLYFTHNGVKAELISTATWGTTTVLTGDAAVDGAVDLDFHTNGPQDDMWTLVITAQDGSKTTYVLTFAEELPVVADDLLSYEYDATLAANIAAGLTSSTTTIDRVYNIINVEVNYGTDLTALVPTYLMSTYATGKSTNVWTGAPISAQTDEVCSKVTVFDGPQLFVFAEDRTEISTWTLNITVAPARTGNTLASMSAKFTGTWGCSVTDTFGPIAGVVGTGTLTFTVPMGVASVTIDAYSISDGATISPMTGALAAGDVVTVTSEAGVAKAYTVALTEQAARSDNDLLTFGFHTAKNVTYGVVADAAGNITGGLVNVVVPWNTDLYQLVAYFTASDFTTVYIAESDGSYTMQCSDVTINDHSNSLTYVVRAQNGEEERWDVSVTKEAVKTENELIGFKLMNLEMCIGPDAMVSGVYDGMNVTVTVKNGTDVTALDYAFTVSDGASTTTALTGTADFTTPMTVAVTAQNGDVATYTVTVVVRNDSKVNSVAKIKKYWIDAAVGQINETAKTIHVWVPWGTNVKNLVASFELENPMYTRMTRSEDLRLGKTELMQYSGVSSNDYTTPIAYTVYAEDCSTVEYFVTVFVTPNTDTGISAFTFDMYGCGCETFEGKSLLVNEIDPFAKRIHITLPHEMNLSKLAPYMITIHPEASIKLASKVGGSDAWTTAVDWTKGPVAYVVTAPDGVTKTTWEVLVENPACQETDILSFALPQIQVDASALNGNYKGDADHNPQVVTIDYTNHTIEVIIKSGSKLDKVYYERTLSCGASICCVSGNCVDNQYLDFSESLCHTCVVTAQDESITQEWTICLVVDDAKCPEVMTESVLAMNCEDTVFVSTNEPGEVFIIHEDAIACIDGYYPCNCDDDNPLGDPAQIKKFVDEKMLKKVAADSVGSFAIPTQGLYAGVYYAFAIDTWGNVSCQSKQKLYIDVCEKEVATLADLKSADPAFMYTITGEVIVTYEETRTGGNLKYVQDASAGIEIKDVNAGCSVTYGVGTGVTGLRGMMMDVNHLSGNNPCSAEKACSKVFVPICCYTPTVSSKGNVVAPIEMTYAEFVAHPRQYDAMFVRINTPIKVWNDYTGSYTFVFDEDRVNADLYTWNAKGDVDYLISTVLNTNYIGEDFPDEPKIFQGINTYYVYSGTCYGSVTPRWVAEKKGDPSDILDIADCLLMADPSPVNISGVLPGQCSALKDVDIINEGANEVTITALYLDDNSGQDEFELIFPTPVPFKLDHWVSGNTYVETVQVQFCPKDAGDETATLVVEYCDGTILEVQINGSTPLAYEMPYSVTFNKNDKTVPKEQEKWWNPNNLNDNTSLHGWSSSYNSGADVLLYGGWNTGIEDACINMRPRTVVGGNRIPVWVKTPGFAVKGNDPTVSWYETSWFNVPNNDPRNVWISTDGITWTLLAGYTANDMKQNNESQADDTDYSKREYSLLAYVGKTVYFWFDLQAPSNKYTYWNIDNFAVQERVTTPIFSGGPSPVEFGGVQVGSTGTATYSISNTGISMLKVKNVELVSSPSTNSSAFALVDNNTYPTEIHDGTWAWGVDPYSNSLSVDVTFTPAEVGAQTAMLKVTYGMYEDKVVMVPLNGEGLSCFTAAEAVLGENFAPSQNSWYTYTAEAFQIAYITSCDPRNTTDPYVYSYDTYLEIYDACDGNLIAENDDLEWDACPSNRALSGVLLPMNEGETIKIFWPWAFTSEHDADGFYFHIEASYPIDGDVCETAIPLTLPVVNHFGTTVGFEDDYDLSPCSPYSNYMDGNDKVYTINLETDGYLTGNILGAYGSIHVLDMCPKEELQKNNCKGFVGGPNGGEFTKRIGAGEYYVIISTWAPPQTVDYLLNMSFEEGSGIDDNSLSSNLTVYPNPTNGEFTVSISNAEATDLTVELVNISGQVVYRNEVKAVYSYNENIDASEFAKGVYYLKVNDGTEVKVEKVVIQ